MKLSVEIDAFKLNNKKIYELELNKKVVVTQKTKKFLGIFNKKIVEFAFTPVSIGEDSVSLKIEGLVGKTEANLKLGESAKFAAMSDAIDDCGTYIVSLID